MRMTQENREILYNNSEKCEKIHLSNMSDLAPMTDMWHIVKKRKITVYSAFRETRLSKPLVFVLVSKYHGVYCGKMVKTILLSNLTNMLPKKHIFIAGSSLLLQLYRICKQFCHLKHFPAMLVFFSLPNLG